MTPNRWTWAGIAVRDDEGNLVTFEFKNPVGRVEQSVEYSRQNLLSGDMSPEKIRLHIELSGEGVPWERGADAASEPARTIGIIGAPASGKTTLGNDIKALTQKPYPIGEWGQINDAQVDWGEYD